MQHLQCDDRVKLAAARIKRVQCGWVCVRGYDERVVVEDVWVAKDLLPSVHGRRPRHVLVACHNSTVWALEQRRVGTRDGECKAALAGAVALDHDRVVAWRQSVPTFAMIVMCTREGR